MSLKGKRRAPTRAERTMACTPGSGWEKGQVEMQVSDVRGRPIVPIPRGRSYAELNERLTDECIEDAKKQPHRTTRARRCDCQRRRDYVPAAAQRCGMSLGSSLFP